jgi:phosphoserine phosphatase
MLTKNTPSYSTSAEFLDSVLRLQPRLAAFDCDGTLWAGDAGEGFFSWEMQRGMVSDDVIRWARGRYADYLAGLVTEDDMVSEMTTMNAGLSEAQIRRASAEYFDQNLLSSIFPEMQSLIRRLHQSGCEVWAVSSTSEWVIREAMKHFEIPADRILACQVEIENGIITDRLVRTPSGDGKAVAIREVVGRRPDAAFGNSRWDVEMLALAKHPFPVNPNDALKKIAAERGWAVYLPDSIRP